MQRDSTTGRFLSLPLAQRFWVHVDKSGECWLWTAGMSQGYGYIAYMKGKAVRTIKAHRWAYEDAYGLIPPDLEIDHLCRNRGCVRPSHLEAVPHRLNVLRGEGLCAKNAAKSHCPYGHPYDSTNTRWRSSGGRDCKICRAARKKASRTGQG